LNKRKENEIKKKMEEVEVISEKRIMGVDEWKVMLPGMHDFEVV